jgi:hypothetical protein
MPLFKIASKITLSPLVLKSLLVLVALDKENAGVGTFASVRARLSICRSRGSYRTQ